MSATAAIEVATTLGASSASTGRGPVVASPESGEAFNKVLNELTAKAVDETVLDRRDASSKSTKRSRVANPSTPSAPASLLEAASGAEVRGSAATLSPTLRADEQDTSQPPSSGAALTDDLAGSWRAPSPAVEVGASPRTPADAEEASSASVGESGTSEAVLSATIAYSSPAPLTLTERAATEAKGDDAPSVDGPPTASNTSVSSASSIDASSSAAPVAALPSTFSAASAAIRTALPMVATSTTSRGGAPRSEPNGAASADATPSVPRRAEAVSVSTDRTFGNNLVVGPNVGPTARATVSAAPNVSSNDTESSPLDVSDLASSISQATLGSDGSYTINVAMHPSDLGHVQAVVSLSGVDLHVAITAQTPTGHAALASAVESLKSELSRSGLNVNVSLRDPESRSGRGNEHAPRTALTEADLPNAESEAPSASESLNVSQIHLIL
jgi:hypothetical protein